jgi:hypothetical protein
LLDRCPFGDVQKKQVMKNINADPSKKDGKTKDASDINKTDKNGAYVDKDGKSKNYEGGEATVNGPDYDKMSEGVEGDTGENAGVFK